MVRANTAAEVRAALPELSNSVVARYRTTECTVVPPGHTYVAEHAGRRLLRWLTNTVLGVLFAPAPQWWTASRRGTLADTLFASPTEASHEVRGAETWIALGPEGVVVVAADRLPLRTGETTVAEVVWRGGPNEVVVTGTTRRRGRDSLHLTFADGSRARLPLAG